MTSSALTRNCKALGDTLVGTWKVSGEASGETTYEGAWEWPGGGYDETMTRAGSGAGAVTSADGTARRRRSGGAGVVSDVVPTDTLLLTRQEEGR
jgi:hypothetical protein